VNARLPGRLALAAAIVTLAVGASAQRFADTVPPPMPDYARPESWAVRDTAADRRVDIFYIQPTTFRSAQWNQDIADAATNAWTDLSVGARQISAFADCCRRFSPRYRQASGRAFVEQAGDGGQAYALAYGDVARAFRAYLAQDNKGRPFIIAGHSQGALHGLRLIREEIAGTPAAQRMIVAYLPGIGIPRGTLPGGVPACDRPRQTGCIASWNSFDPQADTSAYVARSTAGYAGVADGRALVCINPLTFDARRPAAGFGAGQGMLPGPAVAGPLPPLRRAVLSAQCDGNVLRVTVKPGVPVERLPGGNLHMNDIAFFWGDLRADAAARIAAWRKGNR
jgi:hypothetical protein